MDDAVPTATDLAAAVRAGERSPTGAVEDHLERIDDRNDELNAFVTVTDDRARERAAAADDAVEAGEDLGPLHGVPVAIKDLCPVEGVPLSMGSVPFADHVADSDAVLVRRLEDAGAVIVGKTNACEFGHKGTTDNKLVGATPTPFDLGHNAGGSSGGSAAAVAAGLVPVAQGGDGGGSIRIPAALCGIYGIKPSFGRVPHDARPDGFLEHTPFIHRGPLSRTVEDAALTLDVMAGPHPEDPFSLPEPRGSYRDAVDRSIEGFEVAYSPDMGIFPVEDRVESTVEDALAAFEAAGASVTRTDPAFGHDREAVFRSWQVGFDVINAANAAYVEDELGIDYLGEHREEASDGFVESIERGREHSALSYKRAGRVRTDVYDAVCALLGEYDLFVTPTLSVAAVENGEDTVGPTEVAGEAVDPYVGWCLTYPFNMTPHPAASVPAGLTDDGFPVGMQVAGPRHADDTVLAASAAVERERPWHGVYPV